MSVECQVYVKSQSELDIGGRETCYLFSMPVDFMSKYLCASVPGVWLLVFIGPLYDHKTNIPPPHPNDHRNNNQCRVSNPAPCDNCRQPIRGQHRCHVTSTGQSEAGWQPVKLSPPIIAGEGRTSKGWKMINCCLSENRNKGHCHKQFSARESH